MRAPRARGAIERKTRSTFPFAYLEIRTALPLRVTVSEKEDRTQRFLSILFVCLLTTTSTTCMSYELVINSSCQESTSYLDS